MSYQFYKVIHILGVLLVFTSLIGILMAYWNTSDIKKSIRKLGAISHGVGLLIIFVSGFGLAARLGYFGSLPNWVYLKICIWLIAGALMYFVKRKSHLGFSLYFIIICTGLAATFLAVTKPI